MHPPFCITHTWLLASETRSLLALLLLQDGPLEVGPGDRQEMICLGEGEHERPFPDSPHSSPPYHCQLWGVLQDGLISSPCVFPFLLLFASSLSTSQERCPFPFLLFLSRNVSPSRWSTLHPLQALTSDSTLRALTYSRGCDLPVPL